MNKIEITKATHALVSSAMSLELKISEASSSSSSEGHYFVSGQSESQKIIVQTNNKPKEELASPSCWHTLTHDKTYTRMKDEVIKEKVTNLYLDPEKYP